MQASERKSREPGLAKARLTISGTNLGSGPWCPTQLGLLSSSVMKLHEADIGLLVHMAVVLYVACKSARGYSSMGPPHHMETRQKRRLRLRESQAAHATCPTNRRHLRGSSDGATRTCAEGKQVLCRFCAASLHVLCHSSAIPSLPRVHTAFSG